jgi:hypothetical protein
MWVYPYLADGTPPFEGNIDSTVFNTSKIGTDVFLFVSGAINSKAVDDSYGLTAFGGDLYVSGNVQAAGICQFMGGTYTYGTLSVQAGMSVFGSPAFYAGLTVQSGNAKFNGGLSGSLQALSTGEPYIIGDSTINIVTNSLGQIEISSSVGAVTPAPAIITLACYNNVDATQGTKVVGGTPFEFRPQDYIVGGVTPTATIEFIGYTANATTGSLTLWSISPPMPSLAVDMPISNSAPQAMRFTPMWTPAPKMYELRFACSGSTSSDYSVVNNVAIKLTY